MKETKLHRRTLLRGLLGGAVVSIGLPPLDIFLNRSGTAVAGEAEFPRRFGLFFWGNGIIPSRWVPSGIGSEWELSEQLAPLAPVKEWISVVSGLQVLTENRIPHMSGASGILSGAPLAFIDDAFTYSAPTIDRVVAREIGGETRFRSLEFGAFPYYGQSFNGPHSLNPAEESPTALFERLFGGDFQTGGDGTPDPRLQLRRSVLDAVMADAAKLHQKLGAHDRRRLDEHLTGIRELEQRIAAMDDAPARVYDSCAIPEEPGSDFPDIGGRPQIAAKNRAMTDIAAMALACDQTRVFSNWFTYSLNNLLFKDATSGHHQLTHDEGTVDGERQPQVHAIMLQVMAEFAYFVEKLQSIPEGDGSLLDNCTILGTTDCSEGSQHTMDEYPFLIAGNGGGRIKQGIHYRSQSAANASHGVLSLARSVAPGLSSFGREEGLVTSGLPGIEVGG